jgi:cbb3-type cytochrome c oxidase subunit II
MGVLIAAGDQHRRPGRRSCRCSSRRHHRAGEGLKPYTALQLEGRDIYIREGCYNCHSQMIRPFRAETERYGHYSVAGEFVYDHPFQWGSKRTGPDLAASAAATATTGTACT